MSEQQIETAVPVQLMQHFEDGVVVRTEAKKKEGAKPRSEGFWAGVWQWANGSLFLVTENGRRFDGETPEAILAHAERLRTLRT